MAFVDPDAYDRFMGRYSGPLAPHLADFARLPDVARVLDVGCGPGALTTELVARFGPAAVAAVDPSPGFVEAAAMRHPGVDVRSAGAEELPYADDTFDAALAQLVVQFMTDPVAGLREMARVTRRDGVVAACVWDHATGGGPLSVFWDAAHDLDPASDGERPQAGVRAGHLAELLREAGLREVTDGVLAISVEHPTFEDWWEPFTLGVGPPGAYFAGCEEATQVELRERCRERWGPAPFTMHARAWVARGLA